MTRSRITTIAMLWAGVALPALVPAAAQAQGAAASAAPAQEEATTEEIIVTGVLRDTAASKAPVAVTTVGEEKIRGADRDSRRRGEQ